MEVYAVIGVDAITPVVSITPWPPVVTSSTQKAIPTIRYFAKVNRFDFSSLSFGGNTYYLYPYILGIYQTGGDLQPRILTTAAYAAGASPLNTNLRDETNNAG